MNDRLLLYMLHVSWFWIKQRPQFLAEELSQYFHIEVACLEDYNCNVALARLNNDTLKFQAFRIIEKVPFGIFFTSRFNYYYKQLQLARLIKKNKFIWFSSPQQYLLSNKFLNKNHIVIYDCMDDYSSFYVDENVKNRILELEGDLCKRANYIITSACVLKERLIERFQPNCSIEVVNNALTKKNFEQSKNQSVESNYPIFNAKNKNKITYIGTVSSWFHFEAIITMLNNYSNCQLIVVGPHECELPQHPQITYLGKVNHDMVGSLMAASDVLIMPFVINDLVKAVNPVKAYEYIASGKPVILTRYQETIVFEDYAYLYENLHELNNLFAKININALLPKKESSKCIEFASTNTWDIRAKKIADFINS
jgi:glycosyltransferase involved in cell wall biosynthesis